MRILIIEDDESNVSMFDTELAKYKIETVYARSRDSALPAIKAGGFDLIVIDLRIPTLDGGLDAEVSHGLAVHAFVQEYSRGTPIIVFSAFGTLQLVASLAENCERHDIWGSGRQRAMTIFKDKSDFAACLTETVKAAEEIAGLSQIEISTGLHKLALSPEQKRILRIFARLQNGSNVRINTLGGGLSSAKTFSLEVKDESGATTSFALAKLNLIKDLGIERSRYSRFIAPILSIGGFAHEICFLQAGAGNSGGLFYALAREYDKNLLNVIQSNPDKAAQIVVELRKLEANWNASAGPKTMVIKDIRSAMVSDDAIQSFKGNFGFDRMKLEQMRVNLKYCCQHGDLHGLNVLVRDPKTPVLIDYGEVDFAPACLDPLTLELSLLFHPACRQACGGWPTIAQAHSWVSIDEYIAHSPFAPFIRACREWSFAVQDSDRGVLATAYSYVIRQLKYADTNHELAIAIANAINRKLTES